MDKDTTKITFFKVFEAFPVMILKGEHGLNLPADYHCGPSVSDVKVMDLR